MQVLEQNNLNFELRIESLEDLWILSQFIVPNDRVFATTERKVKIGEKQIKKVLFIDLNVVKTSFENDILRLNGEILNETEFTSIGQSHSLNFNINDKIKIEKKSLLKFEKQMLDRAVNSKKTKNLLVLLDKDDLIVSEFTDFNFSVLFEKHGLGSKKGYSNLTINEEEEKYKIIEDYLKRDYSNIIFSGPGHFKDKLIKYVQDKINIKILNYSFTDVNTSSVSRVIKGVNNSGILQDSSLTHENEFISKLLENINRGNKFCYGLKNTMQAIDLGSVEVLLISTKLINESRENGSYNELNEMMKLVEQLNGDLIIVNSKNESGKVLDGLGSIAAILRY